MAFEGTLKDFSLAEIFQLISYQNKTGILTLKGEGKEATITFKNGNIISAESSEDRLEDRLGYRLVKARVITKEQLQKALLIQKETVQNLGYILVKLKFISQQELQKYLYDFICQKIYKLFRWKDGEYQFAVMENKEFPDDYFEPIFTQNILMEAVRMIDEWPLIEKLIPSFDIIFDKIKDESVKVEIEKEEMEDFSLFEEALEEETPPLIEEKIESKIIKLSSNEYTVFNAINGMRSVRDIIEYCNMSDFDAARSLYDLLDRNLIYIYRKEEKLPVIEAKEEKRAPAIFNIAFYIILFILTGFSLFLLISKNAQISRPANFIRTTNLNADKSTIDYLRIKKIALALDAYYLIHETYPNSLQLLVNEGLITSEEIKDQQGKLYSYQLLQDRFIISLPNIGENTPHKLSFQRFIIKK